MSTKSNKFSYVDSTMMTQNLVKKKLEFFNRSKGNSITLYDSYQGFRILGFNVLMSLILALIMNVYFAFSTFKLKNPTFLSINLENLDKYSFIKMSRVKEELEENWERVDTEKMDRLSLFQLLSIRHSESLINMIVHSFSMFFLWWIAADQQGFVSKDRLMQYFEGELFGKIELARKMNYSQLPNKRKIRVINVLK